MIFSWANKQLERLAETVAPISSNDTSHHFLSALSTGDDQTALSLLSSPADPNIPPLDPRAPLNPKGLQPIHAAAKHLSLTVLRTLISHYQISPDTFDNDGNTALHYAAGGYHPRNAVPAVDVVKMLVTEYNASVTVKNAAGRTPYDASGDARVRQYLLPVQLQRETQECLDAGGKGLPPGIDLGGCRVTNAVPIAPPPIMGGGVGGAPPLHGGGGGVAGMSPMPPPPLSTTTANYSMPPPPAMNQPPFGSGNPPNNNAAATTATTTSFPPPPHSAPTIAGHNAVSRPIKADGFHSSASDVSLQQKYGHVPVAPPSDPLPPPPSLAAAGAGARGGGGMPNARYLAYDAVTDRATSIPRRTEGGDGGGMGGGAAAAGMGIPPPPMGGFSVFNPGAVNGAK